MTNVEQLWRFIPATQRAQYERMAELSGLSKGGVLALKMCQEAIRDYCPDGEQVKVAAVLASVLSRSADR